MANYLEVLKYQGVPAEQLTLVDSAKLAVECEKLHLEREKMAHSRWWHEDMLVNQRLTWLLQSQTILLAGYGLLVKGGSGAADISGKAKEFAEIFPVIGFAVSILIALGISAAWSAQRMLRSYYARIGLKVGVSKTTTRGGRIPAHFLPFLFAASWGWLFNGKLGLTLALMVATAIILTVELWLKLRFLPGVQALAEPSQQNTEGAANPGPQADG